MCEAREAWKYLLQINFLDKTYEDRNFGKYLPT